MLGRTELKDESCTGSTLRAVCDFGLGTAKIWAGSDSVRVDLDRGIPAKPVLREVDT